MQILKQYPPFPFGIFGIVKSCKRIDEVLKTASKPNLNTTFFTQRVLII